MTALNRRQDGLENGRPSNQLQIASTDIDYCNWLVRSIFSGVYWLRVTFICHMMTSWHGNALRVAGPFVTGGSSSGKGPAVRCFAIFCIVNLNKLLKKQSSYRWFETPWRSCNITIQECILTLRVQFGAHFVNDFFLIPSHNKYSAKFCM